MFAHMRRLVKCVAPSSAVGTVTMILAVALVVRTLSARLYPEAQWLDAAEYDAIAKNLLAGHGFSMEQAPPYAPTMYREPMYPAFLATIYQLPGEGVALARMVQALLGACVCALVYRLALVIGCTVTMATVAGFSAALHPALAMFCGYILSETLATFFLLISLVAIAYAWSGTRPRSFILAGICIGLLALTRAVFVLFPICIGVVYVVAAASKGSSRASFKQILTAVCCVGAILLSFGLTVAPWTARNVAVFGTPAITVRSGEMMWLRAHSLGGDDRVVARQMRQRFRALLSDGLSEVEADAQMGREGLALIAQQPLAHLGESSRQVRDLWICSRRPLYDPTGLDCEAPTKCIRSLLRIGAPLFFWMLATLMVLGGVKLVRARDERIIPVAAVAYVTLTHSFLAVSDCRYSLPVLPAGMILLAEGAGLVWARRDILGLLAGSKSWRRKRAQST